jgi:flagellar basal body-associated protein FliL
LATGNPAFIIIIIIIIIIVVFVVTFLGATSLLLGDRYFTDEMNEIILIYERFIFKSNTRNSMNVKAKDSSETSVSLHQTPHPTIW